MNRWFRSLLRDLLGPTRPQKIRKNARLMIETLENRLVPTGPKTFIVNDTSDTTHGSATGPIVSLRDAVDAANADNNGDTIKFASTIANGTIKLSEVLAVTGTETIDGTARNITISGQGGTQIFQVEGGEGGFTFMVKGLTLTKGNYSAGDSESDGGGAIGTQNCDATVKIIVQNCNLNHNNTDSTGGAIADFGANLTIQDCVIDHNTSGNEGGGVLFDPGEDGASFLMERTTISNNTVTSREQGGGLAMENGGTATINACTFNGNLTGGEGGGIAVRNTATTIQNSTIYGNTSGNDGGAVWNSGATLTLRNDTIDQNKTTGAESEGGGIYGLNGSTINIYNTIVAGDTQLGKANDISSGSEVDARYNVKFSLIQAFTNATINGANVSNIFHVSPNLGALQNNGGETMTQKPNAGSPVLKTGSVALLAGLTTDQIGNPRTITVNKVVFVDMGAVETLSTTGRLHW